MEQEEEKNIIIEFQRKVLQEANCTAEMLAYLDEIDDDVFREYGSIALLFRTGGLKLNTSKKNG